ncbi:MAG: hypothetical protein M9962_00770 [Oligoflexia bacterium]|nr:hypothetical protein [Oligoflexia bacterium]
MKIRYVHILILSIFMTSCAVAPLSTHTTARTNGKGESMASVGSTLAIGSNNIWVPSLKYSIGLSEEWDFGFQYEVIEYGIWGKYAFIQNKDEGLSFAGVLGTGLSFEGFYGYLGPMISWKKGIFEPYFFTRFNYVRYPKAKIDLASIGEVSVRPGTYRYLQHTLGFFIWPLEWFGGGLEASAFTTISSPFVLQDKRRMLFSGNFSFRF